MDLISMIGASGLNLTQVLPIITQLGPKIPYALEKIGDLARVKEKEYGIKPGQNLMHAFSLAKNGNFYLYGLVIEQKTIWDQYGVKDDNCTVITKQVYKINLTEEIEKIKSYIPGAH